MEFGNHAICEINGESQDSGVQRSLIEFDAAEQIVGICREKLGRVALAITPAVIKRFRAGIP